MRLPDFLLIPLPIQKSQRHRGISFVSLWLYDDDLWLFANICEDSSVYVEDMSVDSVGGF